MLVVLYGPDGAGKSTLIEGLRSKIDGVYVYHFAPLILPQRPQFRARHARVEKGRPYGAPPWSPWVSFIKLVYYALDFLAFRVLVFIKNLLNIAPNVIVFDRYFLDFSYDRSRNRLNLPDGIIHFFYKILIPKPDLEFYVLGDPEIISSRKDEITIFEAKNLLGIYETGAKRESGIIINSTDNSAKMCVKHVVDAVLTLKSK